MRIVTFVFLSFPFLITGCGPVVDDPNNIPRLGRWSDVTRLVSVRANGSAVDASKLPFDVPRFESKQSCSEPRINSTEDIRGELYNEMLKKCEFGPMRRFGARASNSTQCDLPDNDGMKIRGAIQFNSEEKPDRIDGTLSMDIYAQSRKGTTEKFTVDYKRELKRLGDC